MSRAISPHELREGFDGVKGVHENGYLFMVGDALWQIGFFDSAEQQQALNTLVNVRGVGYRFVICKQ